MKRLMTLMLGLAFLTTTVVVYAQSTDTTKATKKKGGKKGSTKTATETKQ